MQCSTQPSRTSCTVIEYLSKIFEYFSTNIFRTLLEIFELFFLQISNVKKPSPGHRLRSRHCFRYFAKQHLCKSMLSTLSDNVPCSGTSDNVIRADWSITKSLHSMQVSSHACKKLCGSETFPLVHFNCIALLCERPCDWQVEHIALIACQGRSRYMMWGIEHHNMTVVSAPGIRYPYKNKNNNIDIEHLHCTYPLHYHPNQ